MLSEIYPLKKHAGYSLCGAGVEYTGWIDRRIAGESISRIIVLPCFCAKDIIKLYAPDNNFRTYGKLTLYHMRYTFRMINLVLASAGQMYGRYLIRLIVQGLMT